MYHVSYIPLLLINSIRSISILALPFATIMEREEIQYHAASSVTGVGKEQPVGNYELGLGSRSNKRVQGGFIFREE